MTSPPKTGALLINLGTPAAPDSKAVGAYLREFLGDPCVINIPGPIRWLLVNLLIALFTDTISRVKASSEVEIRGGSNRTPTTLRPSPSPTRAPT